MLAQAMAALQVHHVARVGDDHISLIWVWVLLEEGKETCKIGDIVVFAVDEHRGHRSVVMVFSRLCTSVPALIYASRPE
jgi:hypothetical protein